MASAKGRSGSSPLTRGKRSLGWNRTTMKRLIPAHAGKTVKQPPSPLSLSAHPRSRGENTAQLAANGVKDGSSPLTRGKQVIHERGLDTSRLIPAHAGKTAFSSGATRGVPAHPRSRGENSLNLR